MSEAEYHRGLVRQLRRLGLSAQQPPDQVGWARLLHAVSEAYREADTARYMMERSIEISSEEMRSLHEVLSHQARHDTLTGLPNRSSLVEVLGARLAAAAGTRPVAVMFIDLDGFKSVNDSLGHSAGDELLVRAAERIRGVLREGDIVGRLGGDEFIIICDNIGGVAAAADVAARIIAQLDLPFRISKKDARIGASIGLALSGPGITHEDLLRMADTAMYEAKSAGRRQYVIFDEAMRLRLEQRVSVESALRYAIVGGELELRYQPIVRLSDFRPSSVEALVRWNRPGYGLVPPGEFIPIAEESRLIGELDAWVLREACRQAATWPDPTISITVNLSARDLYLTDIADIVANALHQSGLSARRLTLEVTETVLVSDNATIARNVAQLRALGVQLAIDDFGTGYSSLSYLHRLPAQVLKIDQSFVATLDATDSTVAVLTAIVSMGHSLGLQIVAEGVELASQARRLRELGCDAVQGYLFARPQTSAGLAVLFEAGSLAPPELADLCPVASPAATR
jgi:diguanylate cyclase (GGDEF)-like protein